MPSQHEGEEQPEFELAVEAAYESHARAPDFPEMAAMTRRARVDVVEALAGGNLDAARDLGMAILAAVQHFADDVGVALSSTDEAWVPITEQVVSIRLDMAQALRGLGASADAAALLEEATGDLGFLRDVTLSVGLSVCRHNRPSLTGECEYKPPCGD